MLATVVPSIIDNERNYLIVKGDNFCMPTSTSRMVTLQIRVNGMQMMEDGSSTDS